MIVWCTVLKHGGFPAQDLSNEQRAVPMARNKEFKEHVYPILFGDEYMCIIYRTFFLWLGVFWIGTGCHFLPKPERWPPSFRRLELIGFACAFVHLFIFMQSSANMWSLPDCLIIFNVQLGCLKIRVCFWCHGNGTTDRFGIPSFLWTGWFV